jgi:hypothetical protein
MGLVCLQREMIVLTGKKCDGVERPTFPFAKHYAPSPPTIRCHRSSLILKIKGETLDYSFADVEEEDLTLAEEGVSCSYQRG